MYIHTVISPYVRASRVGGFVFGIITVRLHVTAGGFWDCLGGLIYKIIHLHEKHLYRGLLNVCLFSLWEEQLSEHQIRGWTAGQGLARKDMFFTDTGMKDKRACKDIADSHFNVQIHRNIEITTNIN